MKQIRINVFETNSSSCHSLMLMSREDYEKWIDHKIVVRFVYNENSQITGLKEWGNHDVHGYDYLTENIKHQISATVNHLLEIGLKPEDYYYEDSELKRKINDILASEKIDNEALDFFCLEDLYLTPEEFKRSITKYDCAFLFSKYDNDLVLIGKYYHS